jgi:hypothetical protein
MSKKERKSFEDLITFKEEAVEILEDKELWDIIDDARYEPIFVALREGPMTVKNLTKKYNQISFDKIEKEDLTPQQKKTRMNEIQRVEKTIYKYLNELQKKNLIVKAGKRIQIDETGKLTQTASENLYGRTAKLYLFLGDKIDLLEIPEFKESIPILGKVISLSNNLPKPSEACLSKIIVKIFKFLNEERREIFQKYSEELVEVSKNASYGIMKNVISSMDILNAILNASEFEKELKNCFKSLM